MGGKLKEKYTNPWLYSQGILYMLYRAAFSSDVMQHMPIPVLHYEMQLKPLKSQEH